MTRLKTRRWSPLLIAVSGLLLVYVWRIQDLFPILAKLQFPILVALIAMGLCVADPPAMKRLGRAKQKPVVWVLAILFLVTISAPFGLYPGQSFSMLFDFLKTVILVVLLLAAVRDRRDLDRLLLVHVVGGFLFCLVSWDAQIYTSGWRLSGFVYHDPNDLSLHVLTIIPTLLYFLVSPRQLFLRLATIPLTIFFIFIFIQTGSRGGFLGLLTMGTYLLFMFRAVPVSARVAFAGLAVLVFVFGASDTYKDTMRTIINPQDDYNWAGGEETGRMEVWKRGIGYMMSNPLTGVGAGNYGVAEGMLSPEARERSMYGLGFKWSAAHNTYVQIGAELGIGGLLAFLAMLGGAIWKSHHLGRSKNDRHTAVLGQTLSASLIAFAVAGFFLSQAWMAIVYVFVSVVSAMLAIDSEEHKIVHAGS